ncbi:unnamed protein product [Merluccius merluccius]
MGNLLSRGANKDDYNTDNVPKDSEDVLVVTEDYPSPNAGRPVFRLGEKLIVLLQEASWWRVRSLRSQHENYIPNTHVAKVYHGWLFEGLGRQKAEALLQMPCNIPGSFMVRESSSERGVYSLSVKHRGIQHYRICRMDNSWYYISPRLTFQCLEDMINHYSDCADGLCCALTNPCLSTPDRQDRAAAEQPNTAPPVVMRRNFNWKDADRYKLCCLETLSDDGGGDAAMSYGVRNSLASYLSLSGTLSPARGSKRVNQKRESRKKKSKSLYVLSSYHDEDI